MLDRHGLWRVSIDGRPVPSVEAETVDDALAALARRVRSAAWRDRRSTAETVADASSALYEHTEAP